MINPKARPCAEATIRSTPAARNCAADAKPWVLLATILASSIAYVDESVVNIALPAIETDLATSVAVIQWLVDAYTLCLSAFLLTGGAAGDLFGRRRIFVIGIAVFAAASLWYGFSPALSAVQGNDRQAAEIIIKDSLATSIRSVMLVCAVLALAGALSSLLLFPPRNAKPGPDRSPAMPLA
jgi:MFS family permease